MRRITNACYLLAVVAINFTLFRPSPVDVLFVVALLLSVASGQVVTRNIFVFLSLIFAWVLSMFVSSLSLLDNPEVAYYLVKITFAVSIGVCSCLVAAHWRERDIDRFLKTWIVATVAAASLGILGYLLGIPELTWDGRAKGFLDDPNMYGAFLIPGIIGCMYQLSTGGRRALYGPALGLIAFGLALSFSRAAIMACVAWATFYYVFLNRRRLPRAVLYAGMTIATITLALLVAELSIDGFAERIAERSTLAKEYDLGHGGRYNRYALSIPYILDHPLGMGLLEWDRYFDEPIHNILLSSFVNYGWVAGIAFTLLVVFTLSISLFAWRATLNPITVAISLSWLAVISCAFLHEAERWRHLWLLTGLVWGLNLRNLPHAAARQDAPTHPARLSPSPA